MVVRETVRSKQVDAGVEDIVAGGGKCGIVALLRRASRIGGAISKIVRRSGAECRVGYRLIAIIEIVEIGAVRSGIRNFEHRFTRQLILKSEVPLLRVGRTHLGARG